MYMYTTHIDLHPQNKLSQESLRVLERCSEAGRMELRWMVQRMRRMKEDYVQHGKVGNMSGASLCVCD